MDSKVFWSNVARKANSFKELLQSLRENHRRSGNDADLLGQPALGNLIYMASKPDETLNIRGGVVCEMTYALAGQRYVEGTHLVAEPGQVEAFLNRMRLNAAAIAAAESAKANPSGRQSIFVQPITPTREKQ